MHDSATLSAATADAGGTVTYTVYTDDQCTLGAQDAGTKTVTNGVVPDSDGITFNNGTVTYTVYTDDQCTLGAQDAGTKTVTNGVVPDSDGITFNNAGDYHWQAVYSGDANNQGATR